MKLLTARPCFLFTVLLSTEDSSAQCGKNGKKEIKTMQNLLSDQKNKIEYVRKMENMG